MEGGKGGKKEKHLSFKTDIEKQQKDGDKCYIRFHHLMVQFNNLNSICELSRIRICDLPRISFTFVSFAHFFATRQIIIILQIHLICITFNNFITADRSLLHLN